MSLICVYLLVKTFVFKNEHFQLVFKLKTTPLKIRAQASKRGQTETENRGEERACSKKEEKEQRAHGKDSHAVM
jgi:hypothetical protein